MEGGDERQPGNAKVMEEGRGVGVVVKESGDESV